MGQVQEQLHVEQNISPAKNKIHRLSTRYDLLRCLGVVGNSCVIWYVHTTTPTHSIHI
jgi:hypothetical protein